MLPGWSAAEDKQLYLSARCRVEALDIGMLEKEAGKMTELENKDKLLELVESMYSQMRAKVGPKNLSENLPGKFARYYLRYAKEEDALEKLFTLLKQPPDRDMRNYKDNWRAFREVLLDNKNKLGRLSSQELSYVLGWLAKQVRAGA